MSETFGAILKKARELKNLSQKQVADEFNISRPAVTQWEKGGFPGTERLGRLGQILGIDIDAALKGNFVSVASSSMPQALTRVIDEAPNVDPVAVGPQIDLSRFMGPRDIPIYGTGVGGDDGDFSLNRNAIDYAPRPPGIARRSGVYSLYVRGDSVSPAYEDGARIYVDSNKPPRPRDYVVIELAAEEDGAPGKGYVKRLVRTTSTLVVVEQFTPPKEIEFDKKRISVLHRVIPWDELLGL